MALPCDLRAEISTLPEGLASASIEDLMDLRVTTVSRAESTVGQSLGAVFVITQEMIHRSGPTNIPDLLRMVPGMGVAWTDANKWNVSARGFNERFSRLELVARRGGAIGSKMVGTGVRFEINNGAAQRAGLEVSSRLLKLARGTGAP